MPDETKPTDDPQTDLQQTDEPQTDEPQADEPKLDLTIEDVGTLKKKVTVTIPRSDIDAKFDETYGELSHSAQVPGFRIGRAPRRLIEKRFGAEVGSDVRNSIIGDSLGRALEQADLKTLGEPDLALEDIELPETGDLSYSFEVEVAPEFDLPELAGIKVDKPMLEVTDERIDSYIDRLRQTRATYAPTDQPAAAGDMVLVDAHITGQDCDPVNRSGLSLRVGPGQVEGLALMDLGDALAGKTAGDKTDLTTKAPPAHPNEQWPDKDLTIALTITEVQGRSLPEIDDPFAESAGFESLKEMREFFASEMAARLSGDVQQAMRNQVCQYLLDSTDFDLPEGAAARHTQRALQRRYIELLQSGMPREEINENLTELQADAATQARRELKLTFILGQIAQAENIKIGEDEINARIAQMARSYNRRPERLKQELTQDGSIQQVAISMAEEKALDKLIEQADVTEVSPERPAKKEQAETKPKAAKKTAKKVPAKDNGKAEPKTAKKAAKKTAKKAAKKKTPSKPAEKKTTKKAVKKTSKKK
ncbi:hypothetical protein LCGC14_0274430 [marine sediment metagenome]|uniref:peptidylprolyl isomerase n=1 Tax=marine sediment metagenome TaxID=412755 RepID=A0A0F9WIP5_9ZZZZ|nr:trigger factor [Phycisphaerae bacterium]HDZ43417.1 trigger factor [Phycisphaerae bacterium]